MAQAAQDNFGTSQLRTVNQQIDQAMPSKWQRLHLSQLLGLPPLLFQYIWTREGYEIHITDLTYIWSERLPRKAITKRAEEIATTIDPGEDPEQLDVLLEKIGEALQKGNESALLSDGTQPDSLEITTTTKLPSPLKPLMWSLKLSKEPLSSLTTIILLPLLKEEAEWDSRQGLLLSQIKQKDYVLGKLFDKLEILGVDLGSVFPSAAGSRTSHKAITRSEAGKHVKGIAPFEEQTWLAETGVSHKAGLATNLLQEISESGDSHDLGTFAQAQGEWWHRLKRFSETSTREASPIKKESPSDENRKKPMENQHINEGGDSTASSDVDEFQRQKTPPRLDFQHQKGKISPPKQKDRKKSLVPPVLPSEEDEATASDSDSEPEPAPHQRRIPSVSRSPEPAAPQPKAREVPEILKGGLGKIGSKRKEETEHPPSPSLSPSLALPPPAQVREALKRPKGGLGMIGGKKKQAIEPSPSPSPSPPAQTSDSTESQEPTKSLEEEIISNNHLLPISSTQVPAAKAKRPGKLGMIGGKAKAKASEPARDKSPLPTSETVAIIPEKAILAKPKADVKATKKGESTLPTSAAKKVPSAPPAEPETEDQRADRKREELKRSLEAKGKAPAKKKRRF
ncbi:DNA double-strand break repair and VJ recombination XRCC4, N-terminal [Penicillium digitatum]|uniref:Non-homologous end-joining factor 1 n=1 Tax=Penicillium digitatum TaxID=36651 RepID=A0A7T7BJ04_PENDI|nr:DNA double-strand break repair and VJ recombination XRCC4, N-terminal [Penicillium digitatum]